MPEMVITLTFTEQGGKTTLTSHGQFASAEDVKAILKMGMQQGLTETWDRLEEFIAQEAA